MAAEMGKLAHKHCQGQAHEKQKNKEWANIFQIRVTIFKMEAFYFSEKNGLN